MSILKRYKITFIATLFVAALILIGLNSMNSILNTALRYQASSAMAEYQEYPPDKTALLIVDAQNGFLSNSPHQEAKIADLIEFSRQHGYIVLYTRYEHSSEIEYPTLAHIALQEKLQADPDADQIADPIKPGETDIAFPSRSEFSAFAPDDLRDSLDQMGIERIVIAGPLTDVTLDSTLRDAGQFDFHVTVITDCLGGVGAPAIDDTIKFTFSRYAHSLLKLNEFKSIAELRTEGRVS